MHVIRATWLLFHVGLRADGSRSSAARSLAPNILNVVPAESAIVIPVPEAESVVGHWRSRYDPVAVRGVAAHITLLYPFATPATAINEIDALGELFANVASFEFSLTEVRRFPEAAYLHPDPPDRFIQLIETLAQRWPEFPPYRGAFRASIPHLTVADHVSADVLDVVERALTPQMPIKAIAHAAWLMCSDDRGIWSRAYSFRFGTTL